MFGTHVILMIFYALLAGAFFALLWRDSRRERLKLFGVVFLSLFLGGVALAWVMYPFPLR